MTLTKYQSLISVLPVKEHALTTGAARWNTIATKAGNPSALRVHINSIFGGNNQVQISRSYLHNHPKATVADFERFLIATLMWGYPTGGRGNNIGNIFKNLSRIAAYFHTLHRTGHISNWTQYLQQLKMQRFPGLGTSTLTKLLYYMGTIIERYPALILDAQIKGVIWSGNWQEFTGFLRGYNGQQALRHFDRDMDGRLYVEYLSNCNKCAKTLSSTPDQVEFFLFNFGRILK